MKHLRKFNEGFSRSQCCIEVSNINQIYELQEILTNINYTFHIPDSIDIYFRVYGKLYVSIYNINSIGNEEKYAWINNEKLKSIIHLEFDDLGENPKNTVLSIIEGDKLGLL